MVAGSVAVHRESRPASPMTTRTGYVIWSDRLEGRLARCRGRRAEDEDPYDLWGTRRHPFGMHSGWMAGPAWLSRTLRASVCAVAVLSAVQLVALEAAQA